MELQPLVLLHFLCRQKQKLLYRYSAPRTDFNQGCDDADGENGGKYFPQRCTSLKSVDIKETADVL